MTAAGGKGANQAVAAARAGGNVTFIARVGSDLFGKQAVEGFVQEGINIEHIISDSGSPSGVALIFVGKNGENSIAVASGANGNLSSNDILNAKEVFAEAKGEGFDVKILRKVIRMRKMDKAKRDEEEALIDLYLSAIGGL